MKLNQERIDKQNNELCLVRRIKAGEESAVAELVRLYIPQLTCFFAFIKVPEDMIEDMVQETIVRAVEKLELYDEKQLFSSWIMTIGRNIFYDEVRKDKSRVEREKRQENPVSRTPEEIVVMRNTVEELVSILSNEEKYLFEMRVVYKYSFFEIAELTGEVEATLRSRFFRLLGKMRLND